MRRYDGKDVAPDRWFDLVRFAFGIEINSPMLVLKAPLTQTVSIWCSVVMADVVQVGTVNAKKVNATAYSPGFIG